MAGIGVAAAIEELRQELYRAQDQGAGQQFAFGIEEAELELQLELRTSGTGDGKVSFGVATVGAGGERTTVHTHRLTLKLSVRDRARGAPVPRSVTPKPGPGTRSDGPAAGAHPQWNHTAAAARRLRLPCRPPPGSHGRTHPSGGRNRCLLGGDPGQSGTPGAR
ncbi:trypco2 family protein [Streptomyces sp. ZL-24]|uniref:trypco2 family protein n=1 Tax=Streptomyces sp. ZL-24 TaxID=1933029 RepID=UPI001F4DDBA7|nr:trypco2 family protein [Streptomyces sp. ZL-24]